MANYLIEIVADTPPQLFVGDKIKNGQVVGIKCTDPEFVSVAWLIEKTNLSRQTIINKLKGLEQGDGKFIYNRAVAIDMLTSIKPRRGRPRKH